MSNTSSSIFSNQHLKSTATSLTVITMSSACLTILFDFAILCRLICSGKLTVSDNKSRSRRIGLLYSTNTYIHLMSISIVFLAMSNRSLYGDLHPESREHSTNSWHCRLLNYPMCVFGAGNYWSCFLQALFRLWRDLKPSRRWCQRFSYHIGFICLHWIVTIAVLIPVWSRSVYIQSEHFCLNRFHDTWTSTYISLTTSVIPVCGVVFVYVRIIVHMKRHTSPRKHMRRLKRNVKVIRRILLLVIVLTQTSSLGIVLWLIMLIQNYLHPLAYRVLTFILIHGMLIFSVTFLLVSPQLKRGIRRRSVHQQHQHTIKQSYLNSGNLTVGELTLSGDDSNSML